MHPEIEECLPNPQSQTKEWLEGYYSLWLNQSKWMRESECKIYLCPYEDGTIQEKEWQSGYCSAYDDYEYNVG
jgi:hypothetical protein